MFYVCCMLTGILVEILGLFMNTKFCDALQFSLFYRAVALEAYSFHSRQLKYFSQHIINDSILNDMSLFVG